MNKRFYVRNEIVPFEEDFLHEFKGHRNICVENLPPWTQESRTDKATRRAVSRTLNAFLNTGKGGTVYLGVIDSGVVKGLRLTDYQKDHVVQSLVDLMERYKPPVKQHRYSVKFVPIYDSKEEAEASMSENSKRVPDPGVAGRDHDIRKSSFCWCDRDAVMRTNTGTTNEDYIIEIKIRPWDPDEPLNRKDGCGKLINIHPVHEDEEGNCYFRRQASQVQYTMTELAQLTRHEVQESCSKTIENLKKDIARLQEFQQGKS